MVTFSMTSYIYDLVVDIVSTLRVQSVDVIPEFLPLSERLVTLAISRVDMFD